MPSDDRSLSPTRRAWLGALAGGVVTLSGCSVFSPEEPRAGNAPSADATTSSPGATTTRTTGTAIHASYDTTEVEVVDPEGTVLGSVTAAIANTAQLRYTGLSDTDSMPEDRGMLFVYDQVGRHTFVMRDMDFGLDIVFADDEGTITTIHHAPRPDGEADESYPGRGQYVLEVLLDWTTDRGVTEGDRLEFDL